MGAEHRSKIKNSRILSNLIKCAEGEIEMNPQQLQAALSLLDRVMPKLSAMTIEGGESPINLISTIERRVVRPET